MHKESQDSLLGGINYEDNIPVDWQVVSALPGAGEQHRLNQANDQLLHNLLTSDETSHSMEDTDDGSGLDHFRRLELKLDLLLSVVTEMVAANGHLPQAHRLVLSGSGLRISLNADDKADAPKTDALLRIQLYLDPRLPRPLALYGHVVAADTGSFTVKYHPLEAHTQDLLDRLVFRHHRRAIALSRQSGES